LKSVSPDHIRQNYAGLAATYDKRWRDFNRAVYRWILLRFPELPEGAAVLDTGCGTGEMLRLIDEENPGLLLKGIDISPDMIAVARRVLPQAAFAVGNIEAEPAEPRHAFDIVLSLNLLHHLNDPAGHLKKLDDFCAPRGRVFLCDFCTSAMPMKIADLFWRFFHPAHSRAFSRRMLRRMIKNAGFEIADSAVLKPGIFWRLQIYELIPPAAPPLPQG
jgi:ubiquinone/menaquinone biosynthesis C-methylase UbiE